MVLAAYNAGPGTISKAIRRSGGKKTYWEIRPYLPIETQGYVPAFIAANYVMSYHAEHNIYPATPRKSYFEVDTVVVKEQMSFDQIGQALEITNEEIAYFNPQYRKNVIPAGGNTICLPKSKIGLFLTNEQAIYAAIKSQQQQGEIIENIAEVKKTHTVRSGEKLSTIARKYGVTVADLKSWNYIGRKGVRPGKKLTVYVRETKNSTPKLDVNAGNSQLAANQKSEEKTLASKENTQYHKVKKGESLFGIAKKYGTTVDKLKELNNLKDNSLNLGQSLKIN
jgi:membrane-bound lytic murein transglycosylase D